MGGLDITVDEGTQGETVYIPACITHSGVDEVVYNDFHIGKNADITIYAGCGVHVEGEEGSRHSGIHRFFLAEGAKVHYIEKHAGEGQGEGKKVLDPQTWFELGEGSLLEMDTTQLGGVDRTCRITKGKVGKDARLLVRERLLTEKDQQADSQFEVDLMGENSGCDLVSRAVAKDQSHQDFSSLIRAPATPPAMRCSWARAPWTPRLVWPPGVRMPPLSTKRPSARSPGNSCGSFRPWA